VTENLARKPFIFLVSSLFLTGCGLSFQSDVDHYSTVLQEEARCETSTVYASGVNLIGTATFEKRTIDVVTETATSSPFATTLKNMALSDPLPTTLPIKNAEIAVYNSSNDRIQCGKTDSSGYVKATDGVTTLKIPNTPGTYRLRVVSRSYLEYGTATNFVFISIKQDKYRNELHALTATFTLTGSGSAISINLIAKARQTESENVEGGAFNILNTLQTGFDYIKTNTPAVNTECLSQKVNVFWKAGFNPMQYQFPSSDPATLGNTSFYTSDTKELFISGGQVGDMSLSNTDHFDDFAIIHESGHFIEDQCGQWTSPGGNHTLTSRIDPRLAWSEGWANYFAAHVVHDRLDDLDSTLMAKLAVLTENNTVNKGWTYFFNSYGFSDSVQNIGNGDGFVIDFKRSGGDPGSYQFAPYTGQEFDKVVPGSYQGEGHTREGAISRGLFKLTNACGTYCAATPILFLDIWKSFDRFTGTATYNIPFLGADKVLEKLKTFVGGAWTTGSPSDNQVIESEALHLVSNGTFGTSPLSWPGYAATLVTGSSCSLKILPKPDSALNNSSSDQRYSNHFLTLDPSVLPGINQITVTFTKNAGNNMDHDLLLFKPGYFFNDDYNCTAYNVSGSCSTFAPNRNSTNSDVFVMNREPATSLGTNYTKTIFLNGLDTTQKYLLDIRTWTAGTSPGTITDYSYSINSNLGVLCPL
jgi:hypothetical protein